MFTCVYAHGQAAGDQVQPSQEQAAGQLRAALGEFDEWLSTSPEGPGWHKHLRTSDLRAQLNRGSEADPRVVWAILGLYVGDVPGLELAEFYRVRRAIEDWLASLPPPSMEQLPKEIELAKSAFISRNQNDVDAARAELRARVERLERRLAQDPDGGQDWKKFLLWDKVQAETAKPSPDLRVLDAAYARYSSGHEGLQMNWFADVRTALRHYLIAARTIGDKNLKARYPAILDDLAGRLAKYRAHPTPEEAKAINARLQLLRDAGQPERLLRAVQGNLSYPNLFLGASAWLIGAGIGGPVSQTAPFTDNILGTQVCGTGYTTGKITAELVPSPDRGQIDVVFKGTVRSDSVGYHGPVQIFSNSITELGSRKRLLMDAQHAWSLPAVSSATNNSEIEGIQAKSRIVQRVASRRAPGQKEQADQIAAQHAEARANEQVDQRGEADVARLNAKYAERIRDPLLLHNAFPRLATVSTTAEAIRVTALEGRWTELASPWAPPEPAERWDLLVQLHESAVNNGANAAYAGAVIRQEQFLASLEKSLGKLPERFRDEDKSQPWTITLAEQDPFSVAFQDGLIRLTLRGDAYAKGENEYPGMNVTAVYRPQSTPQGIRFVRHGALEIFPPGFVPGNGQKLSAREQALRSLLTRRFNKVFDAEVVPKPLVLPGEWKKAGELRLVEAKSWAGWLVLGWRPIAAAAKPAAVPTKPTAPSAAKPAAAGVNSVAPATKP